MDINTEIAVEPNGIRFTDIAEIGIRILFSGTTKLTPRKYQQHENADLKDNADHGSPPNGMNPYNRAHPLRSKLFRGSILTMIQC
jgi:hypothetical protein